METLNPHHKGTEIPEDKQRLLPCQSSVHISRKTSWGTPIPPPSQQIASEYKGSQNEGFTPVDLDSEHALLVKNQSSVNLDNLDTLGLSFRSELPPVPSAALIHRFSLDDTNSPDGQQKAASPLGPFDKWMRNLKQRASNSRRRTFGDADSYKPLDDSTFRASEPQDVRSQHKKSSSASSLGFVTAVKSASISLSSFSIAPRSRRTGISSRYQNRSSKASVTGNHLSDDSTFVEGAGPIDEAVIKRSIQRRKVIEEIISTEESYAADIKFLMNVYVTLLASMPTLSLNMRSSINGNLNEIVCLHEELLGDLHRVVPHSEYSQADVLSAKHAQQTHRRWQSLDAVPEHISDMPHFQRVPGLLADANIAAEVAKVFGQKMHRFFVYEEYGAKYEMMIKDVSMSYRTIPQWEVYQRGLEALGKSLASHNNQSEYLKKSMTVGDLIVKPIQRVCRYPLLFAELLKHTPVYDCPDSHMEIEKVLLRLRETTAAINMATNDPRMKVTMEKTWLLQDRLAFADQTASHSKNALRALGHVQLCGVLHVAWQTRNGVDGQHMISLLYKDFFVLANSSKTDQVYTIQACIGLSDVRVEETDNNRGLQCHTAPYSWKLVFEYDHQLFEVILSAYTPKEELEWRTRMSDRVYREPSECFEVAFITSLSLGIKPMGVVFGKPGTIARRLSIHRATTVGPKSSLYQVIIKNTSAMRDISYSTTSTTINRSQSLLTTNRIPVLASPRTDRVRLENLISDVWTRDILPFPGLTGRSRGEHLVRASASSMIRKLSVASITSNFTKRSSSQPSLSSLHHSVNEDLEVFDTNVIERESITQDSIKGNFASESENTIHVRPLMAEDKDVQDSSNTPPFTKTNDDRDSPISTMRRLATIRIHNIDGYRNITPPLRTSSANSIRTSRTPSAAEVVHEAHEKENQRQSKHSRWVKATGLNKGLSTEGLRGFFR